MLHKIHLWNHASSCGVGSAGCRAFIERDNIKGILLVYCNTHCGCHPNQLCNLSWPTVWVTLLCPIALNFCCWHLFLAGLRIVWCFKGNWGGSSCSLGCQSLCFSQAFVNINGYTYSDLTVLSLHVITVLWFLSREKMLLFLWFSSTFIIYLGVFGESKPAVAGRLWLEKQCWMLCQFWVYQGSCWGFFRYFPFLVRLSACQISVNFILK